jgi:hypothetical protein
MEHFPAAKAMYATSSSANSNSFSSSSSGSGGSSSTGSASSNSDAKDSARERDDIKSSGADEGDLPDPDLKVILLGDSAVGKSKLVERFLMDEYNPRQLSTYALTLFRKDVTLEDSGKKVTVGRCILWRFAVL